MFEYKRKYVWKDVHLVNILPILHLTHHVIKDYTASHTVTHNFSLVISHTLSRTILVYTLIYPVKAIIVDKFLLLIGPVKPIIVYY